MDLEILLVLVVGIGGVLIASLLGWNRRLSRPVIQVLRIVGRIFGAAIGLLGLASLVGSILSGPGTERLSFVIPSLLVLSAVTYLWGLETRNFENGAWSRRTGWLGAVLALSLTAISDIALLVSAITLPTILSLNWEGRERPDKKRASPGLST